jgi:transaldolase
VRALDRSTDLDATIRAAPPSETDASILERLTVGDVAAACDKLRSVYEMSCGADGFASADVDPRFAGDAAAQLDRATHLWRAVERPNFMVKIPGTPAALPAIETCLSHAINVDVTLLFSLPRYLEISEIYLRSLERRVAANEPVDRIGSVATLFVAPIDAKVDGALDAAPNALRGAAGALRGEIAIAVAKIAYEEHERVLASERWKALAAKGARPQRLSWASTSPMDAVYADTYYVEALVGPDTVHTMSPECLRAYLEHGHPEPRLARDSGRAHEQMIGLASLAIDLGRIAQQLENEGVASLVEFFHEALLGIARKRGSFAGAQPRA